MTNLDDIAALAHSNGRAKKQDAWHTVQDIIRRGETPEPAQLATLYSFFTPPIPKAPKNGFDWVARAVGGPKEIRVQLQLLYALNGVLHATDGHRVHYAPTDLADGYYDTNGNSVTSCDIQYPDVIRLVSSTGNDWSSTDQTAVVHRTIGGKQDNVLECGKVRLSQKYFNDAMSLPGTECQGVREPHQALKFEAVNLHFGNGRGAVIMPVRF